MTATGPFCARSTRCTCAGGCVPTNLLERSLGEVQRRVRVIGRFPGETSCLSLCWAVLDLVITGARSLGLSDLDREHLRRLQTGHQ